MSEAVAMSILGGLGIGFALVSHMLIRKEIWASALAGLATAVAFAVIDYMRIGYLVPLFPIGFAVTGSAGFAIAFGVGQLMKRWRRR